MDSDTRLRRRVACTGVRHDAVHEVYGSGTGWNGGRSPSHLVRKSVRERRQPLLLGVRLEGRVADGGSDTIQPGPEVLASRSGEGCARELLCVQSERCNLRTVLALGQSTGKSLALELVVETSLVGIIVRPGKVRIKKVKGTGRGWNRECFFLEEENEKQKATEKED